MQKIKNEDLQLFYLHDIFNLFIQTQIKSIKTINPKCTNNESFKYLILISLHYYDLKHHPERINQLNKYINKYIFTSNNYNDFENNNPSTSLSVYNEYGDVLHKSINNSNNEAHIVKINDQRYNAIKPNKD